ncbi:hypothetical protein PN434_02625 [Microcystis aeruginosa CS-558/01A06]|nr:MULTISPECIES: hypothetical protein [Microcystis]AKV65925.1 hypothetical protein VL20_716 [Microcystis panniformis FACHB-1757]MDB9407443.1 hypothetical protein [Microcystis aeruginosa CS-558/01A06]
MSNLFARNEQVDQTASLTDIPDILTAETAITSLEAADQKIVKSYQIRRFCRIAMS